MELLKILAVLQRRRWLFLQAVVFFVVGAGVLAQVLPKRYTAAARMSVDTSSASLSILADMDLTEMAQSLAGGSDDMQTKIALAQVRPVLEEVVWRLQLRDTDGKLLPPEKLLVPGLDGQLLAMPWIAITQQQGTNLLVVEGNANTAELSALLADTLVEVALADSVARARVDTHDALDFVKSEQAKLQARFDTALKDVAAAQRTENVIDLDAETKAAVSRTSALVQGIGEVEAELAAVEAQIRKRQALNTLESTALVAPATTATNDQVRQLRANLTELRLAREKQLLDKTAKHPDILQLDKQIGSVEKELAGALREEHELDPAIEQLRVQAAGLLDRRKELVDLVKQTLETAAEFPEKGRRLAELQLAADATQSIYKSLLEQEYQIAVAEAMTVSDLRGVEPARTPDKHAAPKLLVYLVLGAIVGVGVGAGLVFLFEYVDDRILTSERLREAWALPVLGMVPRWKKDGSALIHALPPTDPVFEAYRAVRAGIVFAGVDAPVDSLVVTSCAPGEGKSTLAMNLATSMAGQGARVVVVDCDLRRPAQHRAFPTLDNARGLSSVLTGEAMLADAVQATPVPGLHVLTSGPLPQDPGSLVASLRLRQVLQELGRTHDLVIVDAPPVLAVADAVALARATRGTLLVVEAGHTTRRMVLDLRERLEAAGIQPLGAVLTKVDVRDGGYGYYRAYKELYAGERTRGPRAEGEAS